MLCFFLTIVYLKNKTVATLKESSSGCECPEDCDKTTFYPVRIFYPVKMFSYKKLLLYKMIGKNLYGNNTFSQEISHGAIIPQRIIHWLTTRQYPESVRDNPNKLLEVIHMLEHHDWSGVDGDGTPVKWDGWNMKTCTREGWETSRGFDRCTHSDKQEILVGDFSLMHVYFKDTHIRKYLKDENFGTVDAIGNILL